MRDYDIQLPSWLDDYLFKTKKAVYQKEYNLFESKVWDPEELRVYLGTYFPRSYAEGRHLVNRFIDYSCKSYETRDCIKILDYCGGTGGELIGCLDAVVERLSRVKTVVLCYVDANYDAHKAFQEILQEWKKRNTHIRVVTKSFLFDTQSVSDLTISSEWAKDRCSQYDLILTFKGLSEFLKGCVLGEGINPYEQVIKCFSPLLCDDGAMIIADIMSIMSLNGIEKWTPCWICEGISNTKKWKSLLDRKQDFESRIRIRYSQTNGQGEGDSVDWYMIKGCQIVPDEVF